MFATTTNFRVKHSDILFYDVGDEHTNSMDNERIATLARLVIELQAVTEAQGELIARLFALIARTRPDPSGVVAQERRNEERVAYAAAVLPGDEASDRLLAVMARKADAKRAVFELAATMLDRSSE